MARGTLAIAGATFAVLASYPGSAQDDWKTEANARIEQIRKRDAQIVVVDRDGIPVAALPVDVDQRRHRFAFGTAVSGSLLSDEHYRRFFYGHFEWAVLENDSKWMINEPWRDFETYARADASPSSSSMGSGCAGTACSGPRMSTSRRGRASCQTASCRPKSTSGSTTRCRTSGSASCTGT